MHVRGRPSAACSSTPRSRPSHSPTPILSALSPDTDGSVSGEKAPKLANRRSSGVRTSRSITLRTRRSEPSRSAPPHALANSLRAVGGSGPSGYSAIHRGGSPAMLRIVAMTSKCSARKRTAPSVAARERLSASSRLSRTSSDGVWICDSTISVRSLGSPVADQRSTSSARPQTRAT